MIDKNFILDNTKTLFYALVIAIIIRSLLIQPFYIPSSSMEPNLLVGDRLFVTKYSYGYSKHSFPFSPPIFKGRIFSNKPKRGDVIVFKTPEDNKTDYIKRLIGLPGDKVEMISNQLFINNKKVKREKVKDDVYSNFKVEKYKETLNNGKSYDVFEFTERVSFYETNSFSEITVPKDHFFVLGDNRDNSQDSRFVGSIPKSNLVGKAVVVLLSFDTEKGSWWKVWSWFSALRKDRFFYSLLPNEDKE